MKTSRLTLAVIVLLGFLFSACPNDNIVVLPYHACMLSTIDSIMAMPVLTPAGRIDKWEDEDDVYYYVSGGCCDFLNYVYDISCTRVCAADGGITGLGDGKCPEFGADIIKTNVWEDTRK